MASYYYLMAQLPSIMQNTVPTLSYVQFKELALRFLNKKDAQILEGISLEPPLNVVKTGSSFVDTWYDFERALRLSLVHVRASKLKWDISSTSESTILSSDFDTAQLARVAVAIENPLEAEAFLDKARFVTVERFKEQHAFTSTAVFAYALLLLLRERASQFTVEAGHTEYKSIYNQILGE